MSADANGWMPISSAPKSKDTGRVEYVLIADWLLVPDIALWQEIRPERVINGNRHLAVPAGWFSVNGGRSRLDGRATHWQRLPVHPVAP
jgi:hypothetical protein